MHTHAIAGDCRPCTLSCPVLGQTPIWPTHQWWIPWGWLFPPCLVGPAHTELPLALPGRAHPVQEPGALQLGTKKPYYLESFFCMLFTRTFWGQKHGCWHLLGESTGILGFYCSHRRLQGSRSREVTDIQGKKKIGKQQNEVWEGQRDFGNKMLCNWLGLTQTWSHVWSLCKNCLSLFFYPSDHIQTYVSTYVIMKQTRCAKRHNCALILGG
jgi:hypothetical protein